MVKPSKISGKLPDSMVFCRTRTRSAFCRALPYSPASLSDVSMMTGAEYQFSRLKPSVPWPNNCASCSRSVASRRSTCSAPIRLIKSWSEASTMLIAKLPDGSSRRPLYQREQLVAIVLELLVADPGDAAKLVERRRAHRGDAVDGGVMQH